MHNNSKLNKFENVSLTGYLNEVLPRYEKSVMLADKSNVEKLIREVDTDIFKVFLLNSDLLLDVLYTYESVKSKLDLLEDIKEDLKRLKLNFETKADIKFVDKNRLEEFRNILKNFSSEVGSYDTGERILIYFDIFIDENDNQNIFLLTNDILIIGKIDPQVRKYQLVNAFSYSIIDIKVKDETLYIVLSKISLRFKGKKDNLRKFLSTFYDLNYSYTDQVSVGKVEESDNNCDILEFLLDTEQYLELDKFTKSISDLKKVLIYRKDDLFNLLQVVYKNELSTFVTTFLIQKFKDVVFNLDKVLTFDKLIDKVFEVFKMFNEEQQTLLKDIRKNFELDEAQILIMLETQILLCFEVFEGRIFNRKFYTNDINNILHQLKDKLIFSNCDFSYLTDSFEDRRKKHKERCLEDAKKEISALLEEMVCGEM